MNKPRQFSRSTAPARKIDSSLWTETPAERQQRLADEVMGKRRRKENAEEDDTESSEDARKRQKRDAELQRQVEEHTVRPPPLSLLFESLTLVQRKYRGASLIEDHVDREGRKAKDPNEEPSGLWDHARDMSTGGRLMDERDRRKLINDAKGLSERFGAGSGGGYL
jgi:hypothetical protein